MPNDKNRLCCWMHQKKLFLTIFQINPKYMYTADIIIAKYQISKTDHLYTAWTFKTERNIYSHMFQRGDNLIVKYRKTSIHTTINLI